MKPLANTVFMALLAGGDEAFAQQKAEGSGKSISFSQEDIKDKIKGAGIRALAKQSEYQ